MWANSIVLIRRICIFNFQLLKKKRKKDKLFENRTKASWILNCSSRRKCHVLFLERFDLWPLFVFRCKYWLDRGETEQQLWDLAYSPWPGNSRVYLSAPWWMQFLLINPEIISLLILKPYLNLTLQMMLSKNWCLFPWTHTGTCACICTHTHSFQIRDLDYSASFAMMKCLNSEVEPYWNSWRLLSPFT